MVISAEWLALATCPVCKTVKLEVKPDGSGLKCTQCARVYPIIDDIPVMLEDKAIIEKIG